MFNPDAGAFAVGQWAEDCASQDLIVAEVSVCVRAFDGGSVDEQVVLSARNGQELEFPAQGAD